MCSKRTLFVVALWTSSLYQVFGQWLDDQETNIQQKAEKLATQYLKSEIQHITRNIERKVMLKFDGIQRVMEEKLNAMIEKVQKEKMEKESDIVRNLSRSILEQQDLLKTLKTKFPSDVKGRDDQRQTIRDIGVTVKNIQGKVQNVDRIVRSLDNLTTEIGKEKLETAKVADFLRNVNESILDIKAGQQHVQKELVSVQTNLSCKAESSPTMKWDSIDKLMKVVHDLPGKLDIASEQLNVNISDIADIGFVFENISSLKRSQEILQKELFSITSMFGMQNHTDSTNKLMEKLSTINANIEDFHHIKEIISNLTYSFENEKLKKEMFVMNIENIKSLLLDLKNGQLSLREDMCSLQANDSSIASLDHLVSRLENLTKGIKASDRNNSNSTRDTVIEPMTGEDCSDILKRFPDTQNKNGVYNITISQKERKSVYCDMTTDKGGWTVIQRRINGSVDFYRNWTEYKKGFGEAYHEYWIGNEMLHSLTSKKSQELRVDMQRFNGDKAYAIFSTFSIGDEASKYTLTVNGYSGTAGNSMTYSNGMKFSTKDQDNDKDSGDCATYWKSAWWFKACFYTNPNGEYINYEKTGWKYVVWYNWKNSNIALKNIRFMIRPRQTFVGLDTLELGNLLPIYASRITNDRHAAVGLTRDSMNYSNGMKFSTIDQDNDKDSGDCATYWKSAWWFKVCFYTNPNGEYTNYEKTGRKYLIRRNHNRQYQKVILLNLHTVEIDSIERMCSKRTLFVVALLTLSLYKVFGQYLDDQETNIQQKAEKLATQYLKSEIQQITRNIEREIMQKFDGIQRVMEEKLNAMIEKVQKEKMEKESDIVRNSSRSISEQQDLLKTLKTKFPSDVDGQADQRQTIHDIVVTVKNIQGKVQNVDRIVRSLDNLTIEVGKLETVKIKEFISNLTFSLENEKLKKEMLVVSIENIKSLLLDLKNEQLSLREDVCSFKANDSSIASLDHVVSRLENLTKGIKASDRNNSSSTCHTVIEPMTGEDCSDILKRFPDTQNKNGVYNITISQKERKTVYCDMTTDNGGWTVIQRRINGSVDFYRNWTEYKKGFGETDHEYWIGNEMLHSLTSKKSQELRVDMQRFNGDKAYAVFSTFSVGDEASKYKLTVNGYSGTAGDSMTYSNGMKFSTKDQDNDKDSGNCATHWKSAWWFKACFYTNPNGEYTNNEKTGWKYVVWYYWKNSNIALKNIKFMIRPKQ
ncbi:uncharacterized protein LOC133205022 [Saccostrea echinata]|uniref:uncharacterized protein LOC133205022 n=1 Tax=Saccostrea echinata TaxID=191078 RepID=UPI002A801FD9|nr:uncharacterized protein LOC133205022 [Saccostrea echinata]